MQNLKACDLNLRLIQLFEKTRNEFKTKESKAGETFDRFFDTGGKKTFNGITYSAENKNAYLVRRNEESVKTLFEFEVPISQAIRDKYPEIAVLENEFLKTQEKNRVAKEKQIENGLLKNVDEDGFLLHR